MMKLQLPSVSDTESTEIQPDLSDQSTTYHEDDAVNHSGYMVYSWLHSNLANRSRVAILYRVDNSRNTI